MKNLLLACLLLFSASCTLSKTEDPKPAPVAGFTTNRSVVEINETVTFTNTSQNASRYEWNFGNGQTSTAATPTVTYPNTGTFAVTLIAYNADNKAITTTQTIKVGRRYLKEIRITAINFLASGGGAWDLDGSGPDIFLQYKPASSSTFFLTSTRSNVQPSSLPISYVATATTGVELVQDAWTFTMKDSDTLSDETMISWTLPVGAPTSNRDALGNGFYTLTGGTANPGLWNVVISYETR